MADEIPKPSYAKRFYDFATEVPASVAQRLSRNKFNSRRLYCIRKDDEVSITVMKASEYFTKENGYPYENYYTSNYDTVKDLPDMDEQDEFMQTIKNLETRTDDAVPHASVLAACLHAHIIRGDEPLVVVLPRENDENIVQMGEMDVSYNDIKLKYKYFQSAMSARFEAEYLIYSDWLQYLQNAGNLTVVATLGKFGRIAKGLVLRQDALDQAVTKAKIARRQNDTEKTRAALRRAEADLAHFQNKEKNWFQRWVYDPVKTKESASKWLDDGKKWFKELRRTQSDGEKRARRSLKKLQQCIKLLEELGFDINAEYDDLSDFERELKDMHTHLMSITNAANYSVDAARENPSIIVFEGNTGLDSFVSV
ncbi:MAG: hypothetical protein CL678_04030 [Bdellovibrionaceae bacterium]|nr:hypothetical protein [Pseudobdellovibrionaceae bacterium]|tara:strand:- start:690 stop:1790 length:1101 start_codon:yes stop_codon:yes gene_type:complete